MRFLQKYSLIFSLIIIVLTFIIQIFKFLNDQRNVISVDYANLFFVSNTDEPDHVKKLCEENNCSGIIFRLVMAPWVSSKEPVSTKGSVVTYPVYFTKNDGLKLLPPTIGSKSRVVLRENGQSYWMTNTLGILKDSTVESSINKELNKKIRVPDMLFYCLSFRGELPFEWYNIEGSLFGVETAVNEWSIRNGYKLTAYDNISDPLPPLFNGQVERYFALKENNCFNEEEQLVGLTETDPDIQIINPQFISPDDKIFMTKYQYEVWEKLSTSDEYREFRELFLNSESANLESITLASNKYLAETEFNLNHFPTISPNPRTHSDIGNLQSSYIFSEIGDHYIATNKLRENHYLLDLESNLDSRDIHFQEPFPNPVIMYIDQDSNTVSH